MRTAPTVLLVEDEKLLLWSLGRRLREAGYEVLGAGDGREALDFITGPDQTPIDLVLLDVVLPDASGLDLLKTIKECRRDCPVILMTAYGTRETIIQALEDGAAQVVGKPFDIDDAVRLVDSMLRRSRGP
ncbi:MAG: response regulator [Myxococcales bacterium]|nr:response regulator [Myxococcales bacterium]